MTFDEILDVMRRGAQASGFKDRLKFDCGADGMILMTQDGVFQADEAADCTIKITTENLGKLIKGELNPMTGVMMGKLKVSGNPAVALKLAELLKG